MTTYYIFDSQTREWLYSGGLNEEFVWKKGCEFAKLFTASEATALMLLLRKDLELIPYRCRELVHYEDLKPIEFNLSAEQQDWLCSKIECNSLHSPSPAFWLRVNERDYGPVTMDSRIGHWVQPYRKIDDPVYLSPMDAFWGMQAVRDAYAEICDMEVQGR